FFRNVYGILYNIFTDVLVSLARVMVPTTEPVKDFCFCFLNGHVYFILALLNWLVFTKTTPATTFQTPSLIACFRPGTTIPKTVTLGEGRHRCFAISSLAWAGIRPPRSGQSPARTIAAVL